MSDELMLPQVPEAKPDDPEDVSWALSTAEAMWARGDHSEGIKWVRRAAEAASEAENDARALELAKAAADLTGLVTRQVSRQSIDIEELIPISAQEPPPVPPARPATPGKAASKATGESSPPPAQPKVSGTAGPSRSPGAGRVSPSRPPAPLPSRTSQSPGGRVSQVPQSLAKPLGTNTSRAGGARGGSSKKSRRSRDHLENEARQAAPADDTAQQEAVDANRAREVLPADTGETATIHVPLPATNLDSHHSDATIAANVSDIIKQTARSADEWDSSPTQNLTGEELPFGLGDSERKTAVNAAPSFKSTAPGFSRVGGAPPPSKTGSTPHDGANPPATLAGTSLSKDAPKTSALQSSRPAANEQHDPGIVTSQAVRVVVWRDASGVHVAPAGTVVTAITLDAVLVALEPNADLTAWLSARMAGSSRGR